MSSAQGSAATTVVASKTAVLSQEQSADRRSVGLETMPTFMKELIAGGFAGGIAKTAIAPLERIKILLQTKHGYFHSLGVWSSLRKILQTEGIHGLYKGNAASVLRIVPYAAIHFMAYEQYRCWIINSFPSVGVGPLVDLLAGSVAGGTAVMCTYPLDLARTNLAYQVSGPCKTVLDKSVRPEYVRSSYTGVADVFQKVYQTQGIKGLYRGIGPTLVGIVPYAGMKFYFYEELKRHVQPELQSSIVTKLACGASAGLLAQTLTYPLDVVKRQMQVYDYSKHYVLGCLTTVSRYLISNAFLVICAFILRGYLGSKSFIFFKPCV
eukprot:TRINITY_DN2777_c0_g1_i2.p1 TRINITY_DN2777_c0_g1~~TRINITY_DN2777_c0_g1_i2.p1  ORF type:complete len:323 (-),score=43.00 TRINITY_DN2777_c0_g1_i2:545-1513(-)